MELEKQEAISKVRFTLSYNELHIYVENIIVGSVEICTRLCFLLSTLDNAFYILLLNSQIAK